MTAESALTVALVLSGGLVWWIFTLSRRVDRLERKAGVKKPERALFDD